MEREPENCPGTKSEQAGKSEACAGCPNQKICSSASKDLDPALPLIAENLSSCKHKILVLSGKGGVGKSFTCAFIAQLLAERGSQVGVLDVDLCGPSQALILNCDGARMHRSASGISPVYSANHGIAVVSIAFLLDSVDQAVIWRGDRKQALIKEFLRDVSFAETGELEYLLVDTPPGTSDEHLALVGLMKPVTGAVLVTTPQEVAWQDVRKEIDFCQRTGIAILGIVENMAGGVTCSNCGSLNEEVFPQANVRDYAHMHKIPYLGKIPIHQSIAMACDMGLAISDCCPAPVLSELALIVDALVKQLV